MTEAVPVRDAIDAALNMASRWLHSQEKHPAKISGLAETAFIHAEEHRSFFSAGRGVSEEWIDG